MTKWARGFGSLALAALVFGCSAPPAEGLRPLPPPPGWKEALLAARASRDAMFQSDPESPILPEERAAFRALEYWPPAPEVYLVGSIEFLPTPEPLELVTTAGAIRPAERVGSVRFDLGGERQRLVVYRLRDRPAASDASDYFLPFQDATSGRETYAAGRYVNLDGPVDGPFVLDFNTAYNPSCAYGDVERFACPVTPAENRLRVRIEAGERGFERDAQPEGE